MRSRGLVVTQTLMLVFADTGGSAAMAGRWEDADRGVLAGRGRLFRAGQAGHGR